MAVGGGYQAPEILVSATLNVDELMSGLTKSNGSNERSLE